MAKELPYFKFYLNDWLTGNITIQDMATQGVFVNVCVLFWSRDCDLTYQNCLERFKKKDRKLIENLVKTGIIKVENEKISIVFLEKQLENQNILSKTNQKNVKKRYSTPANPTNFSTTVDAPVYNIDEIRGDEMKGDKIIYFKINGTCFDIKVSEYFKINNALFFEQWLMKNGKDLAGQIFEKMDLDYLGYDFTEPNHIQNCFKWIHKNIAKNSTQIKPNESKIDLALKNNEIQERELKAKYNKTA